jgi:hypothetical protein
MNPQLFKALVEFLTPDIIKQSTVMRTAISPAERLAITLRFLATGSSSTRDGVCKIRNETETRNTETKPETQK